MGQWMDGRGYRGVGPVPETTVPQENSSSIKGWHIAVIAILLLLVGCTGAIELFGQADTQSSVYITTGMHPL